MYYLLLLLLVVGECIVVSVEHCALSFGLRVDSTGRC